MSQIHVLQLIDSLNVGGAEVLLRDLVTGLLADSRFRVSVGYSTKGSLAAEIEALGVPVTRMPRLARVDPTLLAQTVALMRRDRPQIVHTHLFKSDIHGRLAARMVGVPAVISTLHNVDNWANNPLLGRIYGAHARLADRLIAVSDEVRSFYIQRAGLSPKQVQTIVNGVPVQKFVGQEQAGRALRAEFGIPADAPVVGVVGRFSPQKDHVTFLQAAAQIYAAVPNCYFFLAGQGALRPQLEALAAELGIAQATIFAGLRKDVPAVLAALDVQVFSSRWEGLPVALLEGMAASKPVVSTAVGGVPEVLIDEVTGLLVQPGDPQGLAQAVVRLLGNPALCTAMGRAGRQRVEAHYSIDTMVRETIAVYEQTLQQCGTRATVKRAA